MADLVLQNATILDTRAGVLREGAVRVEGERIVEAGVRTIEHGNLIDRATADLMVRHEAFLVPTLVTYFAIDELGEIVPGALADLLVVDGDPLRDLSLLQDQGKHLHLVMKGGEAFVDRLG